LGEIRSERISVNDSLWARKIFGAILRQSLFLQAMRWRHEEKNLSPALS